MSSDNIKDALNQMYSRKEIIVSFGIFNNASISGVLRAAEEVNRPVILGVTETDLAHYGLEELVATFQVKAKQVGITSALHLDHGMSLEAVVRCICAGFTSVMIDPSNIRREQRIHVVREVMDFARPMNVMVESIMGQLKLASDEIQGEGASIEELTNPDEVPAFVKNTNIDILAVSVGTEHGTTFAGKQAEVDMPRLKAIAERVSIPLVVHGGSGISESQLRELRNNHVGKMNIGGAIRLAYTEAVMEALNNNPHMDVNDADTIGEEAIYKTALEKLCILSC